MSSHRFAEPVLTTEMLRFPPDPPSAFLMVNSLSLGNVQTTIFVMVSTICERFFLILSFQEPLNPSHLDGLFGCPEAI